MATGTRVRDLLMAERDGNLSAQEQADVATLRSAGKFPPALGAATAPAAQARPSPGSMRPGEGFVSRVGNRGAPEAAAAEGDASRSAAAFGLRTAPGLIPNPAIAAPASMVGEAAAQTVEMGGAREGYDPLAIGIAGALPPAASAVGRVVRGVGRTLTRTVPSLFERAQGKAATAGADMVEGFRPSVNPSQLAQGAEAAGADMIPMSATQKVMKSITLPAKSADTRTEAVRTTLENLSGELAGGQAISLKMLEAIRQDIGPIVGGRNPQPKLKALYEGMIRDLEAAADSGSPGAAMAREAATAFKQEMGAARIGDLLAQATSRRVTTGAEVASLNIASFSRLVNDPTTRQSLMRNLGPDALRVVDRFVHDFRALPPEVAYNGFNKLLLAVGGGAGGAAVGGPAGAVLGAITPEILSNMAFVGKNPQALNQVMQTVAQGVRAGFGAAARPAADEL
jgi:hypothetical protein